MRKHALIGGFAGMVAMLFSPPSLTAIDWPNYGRDSGGSRHTDASQITPSNVGELSLAWSYRSGDMPSVPYSFEVTPLQVHQALYFCTPSRRIVALDSDTGRELWKFDMVPDRLHGQVGQVCRGVSYHEDGADRPQGCTRRILASNRSGELWALDADSGKPCVDFGRQGVISLLDGFAPSSERDTFNTSPGVVIGDVIVLGCFVVDAKSTVAPSGVIRAYDVHDGHLAWAWDMGAPARETAPPDGGLFTLSTPNAWAPLAADPRLGLVFVPLGNPSPDFFGAYRRPFDEQYGSSIVALDAASGRAQWNFQTIHHDLWDLDVPSQPMVIDYAAGHSSSGKAVVQLTKSGEVFVLDPVSGAPLVAVRERDVPRRGGVPEDHTAATQPQSQLSAAPLDLHEQDMWGMTLFDQLLCRINFRQLRYQGRYTPPGETAAIGYPASAGIFSWGSGSYDGDRHLLIVNANYMPFLTQLVRRDPAAVNAGAVEEFRFAEQAGTPYKYATTPMLGAFGLPCKRPPWGELIAFDLDKTRIAWRVRLGTSRDEGPFGLRLPLPLPIGTPNIGGPMSTASGLTFIGAATDRYLRAFDSSTGRELWRSGLPAAANATPMSYVSPKTKRQYVVVAAGGHSSLGTRQGDYLMAFALPPESIH